MGMGSIATTGMQSAMDDMSIISNNIANAHTIGFKRSTATFSDIFPSQDSSGLQIGLGVNLATVTQDFGAGGPVTTGVPSNMAITGAGFFCLKDSNSKIASYTRNGNFLFDRNTGYFMIGNQRLQGFNAVNGVIPPGASATDLQINTSPMPAQATTQVKQIGVNLGSNDNPPSVSTFDPTNTNSYNFQSSMKVYDSLGNANTINLYYVRPTSGALTWNVYAALSPSNTILNGSSPATLTFNQSGVLTGSTGLNIAFNPPSGATSPQTIAVDMTNVTQNAAGDVPGQLNAVNGYAAGTFNTFTIDKNGIVTAVYSGNGQSVTVGQVAIANFSSPQSLQYVGDSSWTATASSGSPLITQSNSVGNIQNNTLEDSNVDLATELVSLIDAQNTFQANAQVEQTYNQIMQTVTKL